MKEKAKNSAFANSHHQPGAASQPPTTPWKGDSQPPRNSSAARKLTRIMLAYSARKKIAKAEPEYSTWKPATISDSPSATSKGARLVSATPEMKYTRNSGSKGNQNHSKGPALPACARTISVMFIEPAATSTPTRAKPIAIS